MRTNQICINCSSFKIGAAESKLYFISDWAEDAAVAAKSDALGIRSLLESIRAWH